MPTIAQSLLEFIYKGYIRLVFSDFDLLVYLRGARDSASEIREVSGLNKWLLVNSDRFRLRKRIEEFNWLVHAFSILM